MKPLENIIVTRHAGALRWLTAKGIVGEAITHISSPEQVRGKRVVGGVPLHLAAEAAEVLAIVMPELPPELRGKELTAEQMEQFGARLLRCAVLPIEEGVYPLRDRDGEGQRSEDPYGDSPIVGWGAPFGYIPAAALLPFSEEWDVSRKLEHLPACGEPRPIGVWATEEADANAE